MIIAGIILIAMEALATFHSLQDGSFWTDFGFSSSEQASFTVGYILLVIIGIALLVAGIIKKQKLAKTQAPDQDSASQQ